MAPGLKKGKRMGRRRRKKRRKRMEEEEEAEVNTKSNQRIL